MMNAESPIANGRRFHFSRPCRPMCAADAGQTPGDQAIALIEKIHVAQSIYRSEYGRFASTLAELGRREAETRAPLPPA